MHVDNEGRTSLESGQALVVSNDISLAWSLPFLLRRAGLTVDVITTAGFMHLSRFVRRVERVGSLSRLIERAHAQVHAHAYDWVIATDDITLKALSELNWAPGKRPGYFPVWKEEVRLHLYSKIGLSRVLSARGVKTPSFSVAQNCGEALAAAREIGYPVFLKVDASTAGAGVFECRSEVDVAALEHLFATGSLLVQKKIDGTELDLSAIYFDGELVHFSYSRIEGMTRSFGPSVLRTYAPSSLVPPEIFDELAALGSALGTSGFVTISCIEAADGSGRYYIEADLRPNVWVDFSLFYGEDAALRIRKWFSTGVGLIRENAVSSVSATAPLTIPYFLRLSLFELLVNRYGVWKFVPWADGALVRRLLLAKAMVRLLPYGKWMFPAALRARLRARLKSASVVVD